MLPGHCRSDLMSTQRGSGAGPDRDMGGIGPSIRETEAQRGQAYVIKNLNPVQENTFRWGLARVSQLTTVLTAAVCSWPLPVGWS